MTTTTQAAANNSVLVPDCMAPVLTVDLEPAKPVFGQDFIEFEYHGASFKLDTAVMVGKGSKSLMPLSVYASLHGVSKSKNETAFKALQSTYNKELKPAFWAYHNLIVDFARKNLDVRAAGIRRRSDGRISVAASWLQKKEDATAALPTGAGRFIADGSAKTEQQSKGKAKRQSKGKAKAPKSEAPTEAPKTEQPATPPTV